VETKGNRRDDGVTEYFTDRGVAIYVYRDDVVGRTMASLRGDDGQRIDIKFSDVPRLIQALNWALEDSRKGNAS
jgi:hypothetical protein